MGPTASEAGGCAFCGARLSVGAIVCYRCGKLTPQASAELTTGNASISTQLGTRTRDELLNGQWRLVEPIGRGSAGVVWKAHDVVLDRPVAVKVMNAALVSDPTARARFERESKVLAAFEHPNLVPILGVGEHDGQPFLVTRLLEGRTLAEYCHERGGRLSPQLAMFLLKQLCEALDFVHGKGVLHRNLKPSNIVVGLQGQVWLLDLGLASVVGSDLTRAGEVLGTAGYLSPEQLSGERELDARSDVYSLGCLTYELLTGQLPFSGLPQQVIAQQLTTAAPNACALVPTLPAEVGALLQRAMAKPRLERPGSAGDFSQQLQRALSLPLDDATAAQRPRVTGSRPALSDGVVPRPLGEGARPTAGALPAVPSQPIPPPLRSSPALPAAAELPLAGVQPLRPLPPSPQLTSSFDADSTGKVARPYDDDATGKVALPPVDEDDTGKVNASATTADEDDTGKVVFRAGAPDEDETGKLVVPPSARNRDQPFALREAPTGPTRRVTRTRVVLMLGALAVLAAVGVGLLYAAPAPLPPGPEPLPVMHTQSVTLVHSPVEHVSHDFQLPELPTPKSVVTVEPGEETFKGEGYARSKEGRAQLAQDRATQLGSDVPELEVKVFSPAGEGRALVKAEVWLDQVKKGNSPLTFKALPGQHLLTVTSHAYPMTDMEVFLAPAAHQVVEIEMIPAGKPRATPPTPVAKKP